MAESDKKQEGPLVPHLWCLEMQNKAIEAGDEKGAKAYYELYEMWKKRHDEAVKRNPCLCGQSSSGLCVGLCGTGVPLG